MTESPEQNKRSDEPEGPGIVLRRTREARGLTIADIAKSLHLDPWMIEALEENDFDALGAPVFAKGHMRQYGSLLGLETDDLMIAYYRVRGRADAPPPPITATMARPDGGRGMLVAALLIGAVVLIALGVLLWYIGERPDDTLDGLTGQQTSPALQPNLSIDEATPADRPVALAATSGQQPANADTVPTGLELPPDSGATADAGGLTATQEPSPGADAATTPDAVSTPATAAEPRAMQLQLAFGGESWVEVYDANGDRLLYNMVGAGRTRTVSGQPPLEVYLGRSGQVDLQVDGQPYRIPAQSIRGNTARFRIEPGR